MEELIIRKFGGLTGIQTKAIPIIASGKNTLIIAPTGSGKTEAAVVPILKKISEEKMSGIACIYVTPLRALNRDMLKRLNEWCKELKISVSVRHGDTPQKERSIQARIPPQFLITTPETLQAIIPAKRMRENLRNLKFLIIDEVHELVGNKRGAQLSVGIERLKEISSFQIIGISATISNKEKIANFLFGESPYEIVEEKGIREMKVDVLYEDGREEDFHEKIANKINSMVKGKTIIFTNTRAMAEILGSRLVRLGIEKEKERFGSGNKFAVHHGSLSKDVRIKVENDFKNGEINCIIATSSLELGIDIGDVSEVIQFSSPRQVVKLVQRVGRSLHKVGMIANGKIICTDIDDYLESIAISNMAKSGILEEQEICENPLDVLAHQIVGILLDNERNMSIEEIFSIIKRAYPYNKLRVEDFVDVIKFLEERRIIRERDGFVGRTKKARVYYYKNLSTIPTVEKYSVRDIVTNSIISSLDEEFTIFLEKGDKFITKGMPWKVIDINDLKREVLVESAEDILAAIPDWEGEEIPTSFEVAQSVGKMREKYPFDLDEKNVPTDKRILIEYDQDVAIVHIHGGLKLNRTISLFLTKKLSEEFGTVKSTVDPYRIILVFPTFSEKVIKKIIQLLKSGGKIEEIIPSSKLFQYKFLQACRFFDLNFKKINERIISMYEGTPIYNEAIRDTVFSYFDIKNSEKIFEKIKSGEIEIKEKKGISKFGMNCLTKYGEYILFIEPSEEILRKFKASLLSKQIILLCTNCLNDYISFVGEAIQICKCGSKLLSVCSEEEVKIYRKYKKLKEKEKEKKERGKEKGKEELTEEERRICERIERKAGIIASSGKRGIIALSTYGVGPEKASKILSMRLNEDEFYKELLNAQKEFIRTRGYWEIER